MLHRAWFSRHGMDRSSCGTQRQHRLSFSWNMLFPFESELSSVSVFLLPFPSGNFWATNRFLFFDPSSRLSSRFLAAQNESNRFYVNQISRHVGSFPAYHTQVDIALPSCFPFVYAHYERYLPSPMGLPFYLGFSAFPIYHRWFEC